MPYMDDDLAPVEALSGSLRDYRDPRGAERNFLAECYRTTSELASNIFRKGYQWPFHATRMLDYGSSLLDLAVSRETQAGRKVFMDFNRNPLAAPGGAEFDLDHVPPPSKRRELSASRQSGERFALLRSVVFR